MSSSLQNIPNGTLIYSHTNNHHNQTLPQLPQPQTQLLPYHNQYNHQNNHHSTTSIYETSPNNTNNNNNSNNNSKLLSHAIRDATQMLAANSIKSSSPPNLIQNSREQREREPIYHPTHYQNHLNNRARSERGGLNDGGGGGIGGSGGGMIRSGGSDIIYGKTHSKLSSNHAMASSDTNLSNSRLFDRIQSTSSSNESVCSGSSLNQSTYSLRGGQPQQIVQPPSIKSNRDYGVTTILRIDDSSQQQQTFIPKKIQRGPPDLTRHKFIPNRDL